MKKTFYLNYIFICVLLNYCENPNYNNICDIKNTSKYFKEAIILRETSNNEFYCNLRIKTATTQTSSPTISSPTTTLSPTAVLVAPTISFPNKLYQTFQGFAFPTPVNPITSGTITNCSINPSLPQGLILNQTTCAISGTPTVGGAGAEYTITASNQTVSTTTKLKLKVIGPNAFKVYGQPNFTSNTVNNGGISANSLNSPWGVGVDPNDTVYITDQLNHRVLVYSNGSTTASKVFGQLNFTSGTANAGGIVSASGFDQPSGFAIDKDGNIYFSDTSNHRVLRFPNNGSTTANFSWGQNGSLTTGGIGNDGTAIDRYSYPTDMTFDNSNNMYVVENGNRRILFYPNGNTVPNFLYGQPSGNYTTFTNNNTLIDGNCVTGINCAGLNLPTSITTDSNFVYIADGTNHRVMIFPRGNNVASIVIGQNSFTTNTSGCTQNTMKQPFGLSLDTNGYLYVLANSFAVANTQGRILVYKPPFTTGMNASFVIGGGQTTLTNFTSCSNGVSSNQFSQNTRGKISFDSFGNLYMSDDLNHRALVF